MVSNYFSFWFVIKSQISRLPEQHRLHVIKFIFKKMSHLLGTSSKRRNDEIKRLNQAYLTLLPVKLTIQKCLKYMAQTEPYRMLKNWSYEMSAKSLDEDNTDQPDFTDVIKKYM